MDLSILANAKFGWIFVWSEIIIIYIIFLFIHRIAEIYHKKKH